jgi:hypothetical protein
MGKISACEEVKNNDVLEFTDVTQFFGEELESDC